MNRPPDLSHSYYKTVKTSLRSIVTDSYVVERLNATAIMAHRIEIHTLQFLKLYLLHSYDTTKNLPIVNHSLILNIMKTLAPKQTQRGRPPNPETQLLKTQLHMFYLEHYLPLMIPEEPPLNYEHMNSVIDYMATTIETMYLNNIKQHFISCVERYINVLFERKARLNAIKGSSLSSAEKNEQIAQVSRFLRNIKIDILDLNKTQLESLPFYHGFILETRAAILPNKGSYEKNNISYDLQCHPEQYLFGMFQMIQAMEAKGVNIMNLFPLRSSMVPKYVRIDTTSLVNLLIDSQKHGFTKTYLLSKGNLVRLEDQIWRLFFKTQKRCFYNKERYPYRFNYMIETDGVGCSIQLIRQNSFGRTHIRQSSNFTTPERYIDEISPEVLANKTLVAIDPNLSDLLYCVTKNNNQITKLRYTQNQRRKEIKSKKYLRLIEQFKDTGLIDGQTVKYWESQLSQYNHKTLTVQKFKSYIRQKAQINNKLLIFYEKFIYRKLRLNGYINQQKSESRFIKRFQVVFGSPDQVVIGIGDYEQHQHRKYKEPVKGKGFRKMFQKAGYKDVYLVDEHKTSCRCHNCKDVVNGSEIVGGLCQPFRVCPNPRPWRREESVIRHGLLMCQTCQKLWCRDTNASLNIWEIMKTAKEGKARPRYLQRGRVSFSNTTSVLPTKL